MKIPDVLSLRLYNQYLEGRTLERPEDVVRWMGAVQAQDYAGAKWAIAQRTAYESSATIDRALAEGKILRTHIMRPTWHLVAAEDIRWLMALTAPRVKALSAYYDRKLGLTEALFAQANDVIVKALRGGRHLTRGELGDALQQTGIDIGSGDQHRLAYIVGRAELDALICSGALHGKQHTYALLEERAPASKTLSRDESLAVLAERYFTSHGPATLKDYLWWSGLTTNDAKTGLQSVQPGLIPEVIEGQTYWHNAARTGKFSNVPRVHLLPNYDEYVVAYTDRSALFDVRHTDKLDARRNPLFNHVIVADGQIAGTWKPVVKNKIATVETNLFVPLDDGNTRALLDAVEHYHDFMNMPAVPQSPS